MEKDVQISMYLDHICSYRNREGQAYAFRCASNADSTELIYGSAFNCGDNVRSTPCGRLVSTV